ncbi:MAG: hypothetical protein E7527_01265 [Ruminococcaceae bacterium]|nr:hypothetical protein [Oscillospiraceae bacterium]
MTKEERLHHLFGDIDDDLVADATRKPVRKGVWVPLVATAASVALAVGLWQGDVFNPTAIPMEPDKGTNTAEPITDPTTLEEAKAAIDVGRYEAAYRYLLTDTSEEAAKLRENFCYVPIEATDMRNGQVVASGQWTYTDLGYPMDQNMCEDEWNGEKEETKDEYTYDDKGRVKTHTIIHIRDGKESREETTYTYDEFDRVIRKEYVSGSGYSDYVYTYDYDQQGNCIREELIGGAAYNSHVYTFTYNERNQLLTRYEDFGAGSWNKYEYAYDADGNTLLEKTTRSNGDWTKAVSTYENGVQTSYEYTTEWGDYKKWHLDGIKKYSESYANGGNNHSKGISEGDKKLYNYWSFRGDVEETFYNYDDEDKLLTVLCWMETTGNYDRYYYDEWGNCTKVEQYVITDPDNPDDTAKFSQTLEAYTYVYDEAGNILQKEFRNNEGGIYEYVYDAKGNLLNHKHSNRSGTYWRTETYTYDKNSNMLSKREEYYDGRWTEETFNEAGHLLTKTTNTGKSYQYQWDLCYYPDGIPADLQNFLDSVESFDKADPGFDLAVDDASFG